MRLRSGQSIVLDPGVLPDTSLVVRTDGVDDGDARYAQRVADVFEPEWEFESDQPPFLFRVAAIGAQAGAQRLGASLYEIAPGGQVSPLHVHHANEELIIVVTGRPILRTADGSRTLPVGAVVACPAGKGGAHSVENRTDEPVRVLIVSTMLYPDVVEHLDTGVIVVLTAPADQMGVDDIGLAFSRENAIDPSAGPPAT